MPAISPPFRTCIRRCFRYLRPVGTGRGTGRHSGKGGDVRLARRNSATLQHSLRLLELCLRIGDAVSAQALL